MRAAKRCAEPGKESYKSGALSNSGRRRLGLARHISPTRSGPSVPMAVRKILVELVFDGSNKGKLDVSTNLQAFALIVTAEPYFAVARPSDVVVMENEVRPDTIGSVEQVDAKYELLPRKPFVYDIHPANGIPEGQKLSKDDYEATLALYEAQNAIQLAKAAGAEQYAPDVFQKAQRLYQQAFDAKTRKAGVKAVVTPAREAAQRAADARTVSLQKPKAEGGEHPGAE